MRGIQFLALIALASAGLVGCPSTEGVGDPCVPEDEYDPTFSGFSVDQVNVESRSFSCQTRICLVNHFRGRVTCPYGQVQATATKCEDPAQCQPGSPDFDISCRIPGGDGKTVDTRVAVAVAPQIQERKTDDAVYCSCRCDGPDKGARYCSCPNGFTCEKLVEDINLGKGQLAGSYCIKSGSKFNKDATQTSCTDNKCGGINGP
jgi:hypothetical protein